MAYFKPLECFSNTLDSLNWTESKEPGAVSLILNLLNIVLILITVWEQEVASTARLERQRHGQTLIV